MVVGLKCKHSKTEGKCNCYGGEAQGLPSARLMVVPIEHAEIHRQHNDYE